MTSNIGILDPFNRVQPGPFISRYQDWIIFTLLLFFFWAVAGIALRKKFEQSRYLRVLITAVSLMLAVGTYYSIYQGWLHFSLQGLGLFGTILLFIVVFFIIFGLMRGYGMQIHNALPLGFALFYISLWAVSPNIMHNIQKIFPPVNGLLLIIFIISVVKILFAFFRHTKPSNFKLPSSLRFSSNPDPFSSEIDEELSDEEREQAWLKGKTSKITHIEIKSLKHIEEYLWRIIKVVKENGNMISRGEISEVSKAIVKIQKSEKILNKGINLISEHLTHYRSIEKKDISELKKRASQTKDEKKVKIIKDEILYHTKMLEAEQFMQQYETEILRFVQSFNGHLATAMQKLGSSYPIDALSLLEQAAGHLSKMKQIYKKQEEIEKYLLKLNREVISNLKKEKKK